MNCGVHTCPSKCHQLVDHSRLPCTARFESICSKGHKTWTVCHKAKTTTCTHCSREQKRAADAARRDAERQALEDAAQAAHDAAIDALDAELAAEARKQQARRLALERERALEQKRKDLEDARTRTTSRTAPAAPQPPTSSPPVSSPVAPPADASLLSRVASLFSPLPTSATSATSTMPTSPATASPNVLTPPSPAEAEWARQKRVEGASNEHIDGIMSMIGLEKVKQQVLDLKSELETTQRQGASMSKTNLNVALLGNPGTGKRNHDLL